MIPTFTPWSEIRARIAKRSGVWTILLVFDAVTGWGPAPLPLTFATLDDAWAFVDKYRRA